MKFNIYKMKLFVGSVIFFICLYITVTESENPNKNQFQESNHSEVESLYQEIKHDNNVTNSNETSNENDLNINTIKSVQTQITTNIVTKETLVKKIYGIFTAPLTKILAIPKVNYVLKNIGTCIVNGAMELITYYLPAPLLPLVASAAGLFIPFEPVVMLRKSMPVNTYRRAFKTAMDTFMGEFDRYKVDDRDPYMSKQFYRRFMRNDNNKLD